jgi:hypothetical protein
MMMGTEDPMFEWLTRRLRPPARQRDTVDERQVVRRKHAELDARIRELELSAKLFTSTRRQP